jgi:hypothetical protein
MSRDALRAFFRSGVFIAFVAALLVLGTPPGSAEQVVSVCSLAIGITLMLMVIALNRLVR